jgi:hypothetical protein
VECLYPLEISKIGHFRGVAALVRMVKPGREGRQCEVVRTSVKGVEVGDRIRELLKSWAREHPASN